LLSPLPRSKRNFLHPQTEKGCCTHGAAAFFGKASDLEWLPLRSSHFQRKNILNFGIAERLRAFRYPIFTEGGCGGKLPVNRCALPHEKEQGHCKCRLRLRPLPREKVDRENPQIFPIYK
jgi:hypothetical protein